MTDDPNRKGDPRPSDRQGADKPEPVPAPDRQDNPAPEPGGKNTEHEHEDISIEKKIRAI